MSYIASARVWASPVRCQCHANSTVHCDRALKKQSEGISKQGRFTNYWDGFIRGLRYA
jgi:hypothetical protein